MELNNNLLMNRYRIQEEQFHQIVYIIESYLKKINYMKGVEKKSLEEIIGLLGVASELITVFEEKKVWIDRVTPIIVDIRKRITQGELQMLALHGGISNIGEFLSVLAIGTSEFNDFLDSINELICKVATFQCKYILKEKRIRTLDFDVIYGFSGVGNYLLRYKDNAEVRIVLEMLCGYLVWVISCEHHEKIKIPGWYISLDNEPWYDEYCKYEDGYINYSMSHGCGGILMYLTNAYAKGIIVNGHREAISKIVNEYLYANEVSGGRWWSGIVSKKDYKNSYFPDLTERQSWCYGNISVLVVLYKTAKLFGWGGLKEISLGELKKIALKPIELYNLYSPIICHGFSGTMTIFRILYEETKDPVFYSRMSHLLSYIVQSFDSSTMYGFRNKGFPNTKVDENDNTFLNGSAGIIMELSSWIKKSSGFEHILLLKG